MKRLNFILVFIILCTHISAQRVAGIIMNTQDEPIEFVNISVFNLLDSTFYTGTISDVNGEFTIPIIDFKTTFIQVSSLGYETVRISPQENLSIILKSSSIWVDEVVITGEIPKSRLRDNTLVVPIDKTVLSKLGTANDLLKYLPAVYVRNEQIEVLGKGAAKIYINNIEVKEFSELGNLASSDIKSIEVITNPGVRYNAEDKAVIRINTFRKAGEGLGLDFRSSYWQSRLENFKEQLNMNYRKDDLNIFGSVIYDDQEFLQHSTISQIIPADTLWEYQNRLRAGFNQKKITLIAGSNYAINANHDIGVKYTLTLIPHERQRFTNESTQYADHVIYDHLDNVDDRKTKNKPQHRLNTYYIGTFGKLSSSLNLDFYTNSLDHKMKMFEVSENYKDQEVNSNNHISNQMFMGKLVFSYPLLGGNFSVGGDYTNTSRDDEYYTRENIIPASETYFKEFNYGAFAEYAHNTAFGMLTAGIRYEKVRNKYSDKGEQKQVDNFSHWFPSLSLSKQINSVGLQLSYSSRIIRPSYMQLSNNRLFLNRYTTQIGDPFLKSTVIHDLTLSSSWRFLSLMASYKHQKDGIISWTSQVKEDPKSSIISFRNINKSPNLMVFLSASQPIGLWTPFVNVGFSKQWVKLINNNEVKRFNKPVELASLNNVFTVKPNTLFTVDMNFQGKGNMQNSYRSKNSFTVSTSVIQSFLNNKLRVELKGYDLFNGTRTGYIGYGDQMVMRQNDFYDTRKAELTVRYSFNTTRSKYRGVSVGEGEINRLK